MGINVSGVRGWRPMRYIIENNFENQINNNAAINNGRI
jgi:hypothetical protein